MNKYQRISLGIFIGVVSFTILYFATLFFLPDIIDLNNYKDEFFQSVEKQSGFKFSCEDVRLKRSFSPYLNIQMHHTLVLYPNNEIFLKLKDSELKVKLLPLLFKKVVITNAKLSRPIINLTLYKDFSTSLDKFVDVNKNITSNGFLINSVIKDTTCERYKLKIQDETTKKLFYFEGDELFFKDVKLNEKLHFLLKGSLYQDGKEYIKYDLDFVAPFSENRFKFVFSPFKAIYDSDIKGNVLGKILVDKNNNINGKLDVKDISLKIDDVVLSDNKISLNFKGQDIQLDSLLHTSKSDFAQINGKFACGKKKNIDLTAQVRNVNLTNLHKIVSLISQTLNIQNQFRDVKISGLVNADFVLNSDLKKLKSNGRAEIISANIEHKSIPYQIRNINSVINFDNNKVKIENANVLVDRMPVYITGVINEDITSQFEIKTDNLKVKKIPAQINNVHVKVNADNQKYYGTINCSGIKSDYINADTLNLVFDDKKITIPQSVVNFKSSPVTISGSIHKYLKNPEVKVNFDGNVHSVDIVSILKTYINQPYRAQGFIKANGDLLYKDGLADVKLSLIADKNNYLSYAVIKELFEKQSVLNIHALVKNKKVQLKNLSLIENSQNEKNEIISMNGNLSLDSEPKFENFRISIPNSLSFSTNFFGGEEISLNADILLNETFKNLKIEGVSKIFTCNVKKYLTAIKNADLKFSKDNIKLVAPNVQINNSKLNILADINPKIKDKIKVTNLQLHSSILDMNSLFKLIENQENPFANSCIFVKNGVATINNFFILDLKVRDISTDFSFDENILKLKGIYANAYNGEITGNINYDISNHVLTLLLNAKNVLMKEALYDLCKIEDNISGIADFKTNLSLKTGEYNDVINSLSGKLDFTSTNGKMGTLGKFEYYLYAQNILYHGFLKTTLNRIADIFTKDTTSQYRSANGTLFFDSGYMMTENTKTIGTDMSLYVKGRHNLLSNHVNIDIYGRISDEITSKLGTFGNYSISDFMDNQKSKTVSNLLIVPKNIVDEIPLLYNQGLSKTNMFKVNILGDINSLGSINSFMWILPKDEPKEELPDFSDMVQNL